MPSAGGWEAIRDAVRQRIGLSAYRAWFESLQASIDESILTIHCPDRFSRDWIESKHLTLLREIARDVDAGVSRIQFEIRSPSTPAPVRKPARTRPEPAPAPAEATLAGFEGFVVDPGNVLALEAARAVASGDAGRCSPVVFTGTGVGKTHLCRAIRQNLDSNALLLSSEDFTAEVTQGIRNDRMAEVRRRYRRALNVLILEDVQFLRGKRATQIELFHTLDHLIARGTPVVLTADRPPHGIDGLDEQLVSRMSAGLVACIEPPRLATRRAILREKAAAGGLRLPDDALEVLAARSVESVHDLIAGLNQAVMRATLLNQPLTLESVRDALHAVDTPGRPRSIGEILTTVARSCGTSQEQLCGPSRRRSIARSRHLAMYLCRCLTDASFNEIGHAFGNRDHSTVIHAVRSVEARALEDPQVRYQLEAVAGHLGADLRQRLNG